LLQGEDRDTKWVLYVLSFWLSLFIGIIFAIVAISWIVHMVIYVIIRPSLHPFLNSMFETLDDVFSLFGVAFFAVWCFFLILAAIKGFTKLGLNFGFITLYPMKVRLLMSRQSSIIVTQALDHVMRMGQLVWWSRGHEICWLPHLL
jgi:LMBR1 domain-containing protein 1